MEDSKKTRGAGQKGEIMVYHFRLVTKLNLMCLKVVAIEIAFVFV